MKLGALKSSIRDFAGPTHMRVRIAGTVEMQVSIVKGTLIEALDAAFPEGRAQETGLKLREDGFLTREGE